MQTPTPHQTPDDQQLQKEHASQPLYEFATEYVPPAQEASGGYENEQALEEAIRQGLIYPPPPSFYQNMPFPPEPPYLPPLPTSPSVGGAVGGPAQTPPEQPPVKRSRAWIWIVSSILAVTLIASISLCGWGISSIFGSTTQKLTGALNVVDNYYSAIQHKQYDKAYSYLAPQGNIQNLTVAQFTKQAQDQDRQLGDVSSYTSDMPSYSVDPQTGPDLTHLTIPVEVTRGQHTYTVQLTVVETDGQWKITDFNKI
jgi:hypothetical protein